MTRTFVTSVDRTPLRIWLFTDCELPVCIPQTILSVMTGLAVAADTRFTRRLSLWRLVTNQSFRVVSTRTHMYTLPATCAAAVLLTAVLGSFSAVTFGAALVVVAHGLVARIAISRYFREAELRQSHRPLNGSAAVERSVEPTFAQLCAEAEALPDRCVRSLHDKHIIYFTSLLGGVALVPLFFLMLIEAGWLQYALLTLAALFVTNGFEPPEHIASHSPRGVILIRAHAPISILVLDVLRRYVVWPMYG